MNKFVKQVPKHRIYVEHLRSLNGMLELTEKELLLMAEIMKMDDEYVDDGKFKNVISTKCRARLCSEVGVTSDNLSRYIKRFKTSGMLQTKFGRDIFVNPALMPKIEDNKIEIVMIINIV